MRSEPRLRLRPVATDRRARLAAVGTRPTLDDLQRRHREALKAIDHLLEVEQRKGKGITRAERHLRELRDDREDARKRGDTARAAILDEQAADVFERIAARRDDRHETRERITELERKAAVAEARIEKRRGRKLDTIDCLDGAAMPRGHKLVILDCREAGYGGSVSSADRTPANCDRCSDKSSQAELWAMAQNGTGAPANPPASFCSTCGGTHEYVNDGTAYPSEPKGKRGPWWWLGLDLTLGDEFLQVAGRLGYRVRRPYMPREPWHLNFVGDPTPVLTRRGRV